MIEARIRALEQSTMIALTLFASQSKQIKIKIVDLKDILGLYCGIKVVIQCQIVDFTLSQYIVIRIAIRPYLSQYIAIHFLVAIPIPNIKHRFNNLMELTILSLTTVNISIIYSCEMLSLTHFYSRLLGQQHGQTWDSLWANFSILRVRNFIALKFAFF